MTSMEPPRLPSRQHNLSRNTAAKSKCEFFAAALDHIVSKSGFNALLTCAFDKRVSLSLLP